MAWRYASSMSHNISVISSVSPPGARPWPRHRLRRRRHAAGHRSSEADIQPFLDRRKPGQSKFTTQRQEADAVKILSGVFEGETTGTPIRC